MIQMICRLSLRTSQSESSHDDYRPRQPNPDRLAVVHLILAAFLAMFALCPPVSFAALAGPPFFPPSRPRATAAGFFSLGGLVPSGTIGV